ncbi:flagellar basal-body MS-ring/collar protein FliF [Alloalcanivorax mobilis]|uniref:flagellar basal-body MS-ring/collar protein FliF n=1 Tax=Alloalcanivorax mobilis TaxID=2019569 RepID=UPI000C78699A|nr:flagellar basal-body MS-ring/collar protein FliF [Alloalcanivorax mobilis]
MSAADNPGNGARAGLDQLWARLRANPLVPLLIAGAATVAVVAALLMWASAPQFRVLYSNLNEADGGRIITELEQRGVPYQFSEGGRALLVPGDRVYDLRLRLAEQGLPQAGNVGFEIMDKQAFGISQFAERVNFQRGLEGELASSIQALRPVSHARVHLAMAKPSVFIRDREPAKASVVLTLQPGRALGEGQVNAIVHMVSSSVPELASEDVTVVDQDGRLLSRPDGAGGGLDGTQLDYVQQVERNYQRRIESILAPILGAANVHAQVTAAVDFTHREETAEHYGPNQNGAPAAVRSTQHNVTYNGEGALAEGIPGALSNTPPGTAASPVGNRDDTNDNGDDQDTDTTDNNPDGHLQRGDVTNYEVDRNITHTRHQRPRVERLSVAVVVNYREQLDDQGLPEQVPLDDADLQRIKELTRQAMGFSAERGDGLEVVNSRFTERADEAANIAWQPPGGWLPLAMTLLRYLLVALAALLLYLWVVRPLVRRYSQAPPASAAPARPRFQATVGGADDDQDEAPGEAPAPRRRRRQSGAYQQNLTDLQEMADEDPAMVAMIVRTWMKKDD